MVQVYLASSVNRLLEDKERQYLNGIPETMRSAIQRYLRWENRQATLFGKLLLQHALRRYTSDWEQPFFDRLEYLESGKPFVRGAPAFNISHSGEIVVLALVDAGEIGIDVEKIRPIQIQDFSRYLPEVSEFKNYDTSLHLSMFYDCWTKKEAVLKGEGTGLLAPLEQVILDGATACYHDRVWCLQQIDCGNDYCCHVATSEYQTGCTIQWVNF